MNTIQRFLTGALIAGGLAVAATPASARVDVQVGVYVPGASVGYYAPPPPPRVIWVDDYYRPYPPPRRIYYAPPPPPRYGHHHHHHHHRHHDRDGDHRRDHGWRR